MSLIRQDLQQPDREGGRARRRRLLQEAISEESLSEEAFATFLLEQEIQPTVGHEPRSEVRVKIR
jgi:hypothetical protein